MSKNILHLIQQSPTASSAVDDFLAVYRSGDAIVLMHDAVYAILSPNLPSTATVYAINSDLAERCLLERLPAKVNTIDYSALVELCTQFPHSMSWF